MLQPQRAPVSSEKNIRNMIRYRIFQLSRELGRGRRRALRPMRAEPEHPCGTKKPDPLEQICGTKTRSFRRMCGTQGVQGSAKVFRAALTARWTCPRISSNFEGESVMRCSTHDIVWKGQTRATQASTLSLRETQSTQYSLPHATTPGHTHRSANAAQRPRRSASAMPRSASGCGKGTSTSTTDPFLSSLSTESFTED